MARLFVGGESSDYDLHVKKGYVIENDGEEDGFFGKLSTIKCVIEPSEGFKIYKLRVEFNPNNKRNRGARFSRGGFWAGVHDQNVPGELGSRYFTSCEMKDETTGFQIDIEQWKWGNQPEISFRRDDRHAPSKKIYFTFASRPFFGDLEAEGEVEGVVLRFTLEACKESGGRTITIGEVNVTQRHSDARGKGDDEKLWNLHDYGAFNLHGKGNSVHPKQLYTCNALRRTIMKEFPNKKKIQIGYIGPDTTENLRSVIRILSEDADLKRKRYQLHVLYDKEWDIPTAVHNFEGTDFELTKAPLKPNDVFVSQVLSGEKKLPKIDILVATYVGPWAVFTSKESKENYQNLLQKIITNGTVFITVDPSNPKNCVISHAKRTEIYGTKVTLTDFYTELGFEDEKMTWKQADYPVVKVRKWTRGGKS
jgi:hypothetical protein